MKRQHYTVSGRVQGVGYRYFCRQTATALMLTGWVRNTTSGTVELEAQGDCDALKTLQSRLQDGPPFARVAAIQVHDIPTTETETDFQIRH